MGFNRFPLIYTLCPHPSDSNLVGETRNLSNYFSRLKKVSVSGTRRDFFPYQRPLKKWRGTESYYWHLIYNIRKNGSPSNSTRGRALHFKLKKELIFKSLV